jgi:hypothetical protein
MSQGRLFKEPDEEPDEEQEIGQVPRCGVAQIRAANGYFN